MSDSDYEPALTESTDTGADSAPVERRGEPKPDPVQLPAGAVDDPDHSEPRQQRVWNPKSRQMFRDLAAKVKAGEVSVEANDLVPMEHAAAQPVAPAPAPAPAQPAVPATASPAAQAAAVIPAPVPRPVAPQPDVAKVAEEQRKLALDMREKQLAEREAALVAKEKAAPTRGKLVENPVPTLAQYIRDEYGITDDAELKDTITDLMTEVSEQYHGVKLPDDVKARVEGRKAVRLVKASGARLAAREAEIAERQAAQARAEQEAREKADAAEHERRAVEQSTGLVTQAQATYPYLAVQDNAGAIVWEVLKEAHNLGHKIDWQGAAQYANDFYKTEFEKEQAATQQRSARLQTLLAPAATPAPAPAAASPGGAPGPAPKQPAAPIAPPSPQPTPTVDPADDLIGEDRRERRARSARALLRKHGLGANNA